MSDRVGRCHDCTAPQTEVNMLSRHILELQKDKGELIDKCRELKKENAELKDYRLTTVAKQQTGMSKYALNLEHKLSWYDDQLTKAKEHIRTLISCLIDWVQEGDKDYCYIEDAEQFLKNDDCPDVMCEDCTKEDCGIRQLGLVKVKK